MRPQQQNRRMRGRNNTNRKGPNPLTRNYESNGPDVKIRGSAQQIAEKYTTLARDAHSSGDRVMAENYLQHAEHYNRIIAAAQAQMPTQQQMRDRGDDMDDDMDDDGDDEGNAPQETRTEIRTQQPAVDGSGPQPVIDGMPAEVALNQEPAEMNGGREHRANGQRPGGGEHEDGPRRPRRPRRGRGRPDFNAGTGDGQGGGDGAPVAEAAGQDGGQNEPARES
jgi:hypothetical protein